MRVVNVAVQDLTLHPALEAVPKMPAAQWGAFVEDVRLHGIREAIQVQDNVILHGRHRWEGARECGQVRIPAMAVNLSAQEQVMLIIRNSRVRANLSDDQRAAVAVEIGELLIRLSRHDRAQRAARAGGRGREVNSLETGVVPELDRRHARVMEELRHETGISYMRLRKAFAVIRRAPDLHNAVKAGSSRLADAFRELNKRELVKAVESSPVNDIARFRLLEGDFVERAAAIAAESIDLIVTDPPYGKGIVEKCERLAEIGRSLLKPGGSLLVMTGQLWLPEILAAMARHLDYHWMVAYLMPGPHSARLAGKRVNSFWRAVLWFAKGRPVTAGLIGDVCNSARREQQYHKWQASENGWLDLVGRFAKEGDVILDPFCGSSTTGVAALKLGCSYIGIDTDAEAIRISSARLIGEEREKTQRDKGSKGQRRKERNRKERDREEPEKTTDLMPFSVSDSLSL